MKNGKIRIVFGWILIAIQIFSYFVLSSTNAKIFYDGDDVCERIRVVQEDLSFRNWCYGFELGNEKFKKTFDELFEEMISDGYIYGYLGTHEYSMIRIRESLGARSYSLRLLLFDFNVLIGYNFYGILGVLLLIFGVKANEKDKENEMESPLDKIESRAAKKSKVICISLLVTALLLHSIILWAVNFFWNVVTPMILLGAPFIFLPMISLVFIIVFFTVYVGKKKSVLLASSVILFAINKILSVITALRNSLYIIFETTFQAFTSLIFTLLVFATGVCYLVCGIKLYYGKEKSTVKNWNLVGMSFILLYGLIYPLVLGVAYDELYFREISIVGIIFSVVMTIYITVIPCDHCIDSKEAAGNNIGIKKVTEQVKMQEQQIQKDFIRTGDSGIADVLDKVDQENVLQDKSNEETPAAFEDLLFCRKCGAKLLADSIYCSKCGTKVESI